MCFQRRAREGMLILPDIFRRARCNESAIDRDGVHFNKDLAFCRPRRGHVFDAQDFRTAEFIENDRSQDRIMISPLP